MELNIAAVTINQQLCDPKFRKVLLEKYYLFNDRLRIGSDYRIELNPDYKDQSWYFGRNINVPAIGVFWPERKRKVFASGTDVPHCQ